MACGTSRRRIRAPNDEGMTGHRERRRGHAFPGYHAFPPARETAAALRLEDHAFELIVVMTKGFT